MGSGGGEGRRLLRLGSGIDTLTDCCDCKVNGSLTPLRDIYIYLDVLHTALTLSFTTKGQLVRRVLLDDMEPEFSIRRGEGERRYQIL